MHKAEEFIGKWNDWILLIPTDKKIIREIQKTKVKQSQREAIFELVINVMNEWMIH